MYVPKRKTRILGLKRKSLQKIRLLLHINKRKLCFLPTNCKPKRRKVYENFRNRLKDLKGNGVNKKVHHVFTKIIMTIFAKICTFFHLKTKFFPLKQSLGISFQPFANFCRVVLHNGRLFARLIASHISRGRVLNA